MSEYQYYDFYKIDEPLTESECKKIRQISSRAIITPNQAIFNYSYGDFRGDPEKVLAEHFDMMLYVANWGTKQLLFRLPCGLVDIKKLKPYCVDDIISLSTHKQYIILKIFLDDEEGGGWAEEEGTLSKLLPIRNDLLKGDYRCLYLAWLASLNYYEINDNDVELPIPVNLKNLSFPLKHFIDFLQIDHDLLEAASCISKEINSTLAEPEKWITKLSETERNTFLTCLLKGEPHLAIKLNKRLEELSSKNSIELSHPKPRLVKDLLKKAEQLKEDRIQKNKVEKERARIKELNAIAGREPMLWKHVADLIQSKTSKGYDEAVRHLVDLRDLAHYSQKPDRFAKKISQIHQDFRHLSSLIAKLYEKKLI
ncbi:MAG TPA: hypothetical protein VHZ76_05150 [Gammaproteobacteria bacterium]|jgi:hypothetical protein|nr:hypothetical protein [Gammaproteobacteria bacterium]